MRLKHIVIMLVIVAMTATAWAGVKGPHIDRLINKGKGNFAGALFAKSFVRNTERGTETYAHLFIEADKAALPALKALGAEINTVTASGIMTVIAPVAKIGALTAVAGVKRIEVGHAVKKMMDESAGMDGVNLPDTTYPRFANTGAGAIVAVIDTGIDIEHPDFLDNFGNTRVLAIWDHTLDPADVGYTASNPVGFTYGTEWPQGLINQGYSACAHRDKDGHGTHVAGTAAGNGSGSAYNGPYTGLAPEADLLIVKFDFDNEKNRNTDTAIVDAINWIFQKSTTAGKPCVINMSLGSDYGPHDGSTLEERSINDLVGADKIVCTSAGNAGATYGGNGFAAYGPPLHGDGNFGTAKDIVFETAPGYTPSAASDYVFFDTWYEGSDSCRVQITTPSGLKYPPHFWGSYRNLWKTNGTAGGFNTPEGFIYVENISGSASFWDTNNGDNNIYIEISDSYGYNPAAGKWVVELIPLSGTGDYNAWHGFSDSMNNTYFWYDSGTTSHIYGDTTNVYLSDSVMTIGKPATATGVISIGAYQTKNVWPAREYVDWTNPALGFGFIWQSYGPAPIDYYDAFVMHDLANFSSRGPSRDGRLQPFISGPGVGIVASLSQTVLNDPNENYFRRMNRVEYNGYYATLQGTSMSCPHATGSVALLLEEAASRGLNPTPDDIKTYLSSGNRSDTYTGPVPNNDWGYGKIDVTSALQAIP